MLEAYAFLAVFTLQILATSVLYPAWFVRYVRLRLTRLPADRVAQMYPDVDVAQAQERILRRYRALNAGFAVLGLLLLVWLYSYLQRPDWNPRPLEVLVTGYFSVALVVPLGLIVWFGLRFNKQHKRPMPQTKRKAVLQRRGLFDFVSPLAVVVAVVGYVLFAAFVIYVRERPFPGFAGLITLAGVTLTYSWIALVIYIMLYGKNRNQLDTYAGRLHAIGTTVKSGVYTCIAIVVYVSLNFALRMLELQRWEPFALSSFYVICALLASLGVMRYRADTAESDQSLVGV
jgi:hypothetical protein